MREGDIQRYIEECVGAYFLGVLGLEATGKVSDKSIDTQWENYRRKLAEYDPKNPPAEQSVGISGIEQILRAGAEIND